MLLNRWVLVGGWFIGLAAACLAATAIALYCSMVLSDEREARIATDTHTNLHQIAYAMHEYRGRKGHFPPAYLLGNDGKPAHSWRVLILPYMGEEALFRQYKFDEPWDGPNNRQLADRIPMRYRNSNPRNTSPATRTSYVVLVGARTAFPGSIGVRLEDIIDAHGETILLAEAEGFDVHWMEPRDWDVGAFGIQMSDVTKPGFSSYNRRGPLIACVDATIRGLSLSAPAEQLRAMSTIAGGEKVNLGLVEAN